MTTALYEPLIERDLDAFPSSARAYLESHSPDELWIAVTRFAVLAYAPSQHSKRAVMACLATHDLRDELGGRWTEMTVECARYAAASRPPWSEPPMLDPPPPSSGDLAELRQGDRLLAERWLSARLDDAEVALRDLVHCDALLMLDTATRLLPLLGEKGRYALLRMPVLEFLAAPDAREEDASLETLIARAIEAKGSPEAVTPVFWKLGRPGVQPGAGQDARPPIYTLARDYAQTLIAHTYDLPQALLDAIHHNLEHGDSFADWSFA